MEYDAELGHGQVRIRSGGALLGPANPQLHQCGWKLLVKQLRRLFREFNQGLLLPELDPVLVGEATGIIVLLSNVPEVEEEGSMMGVGHLVCRSSGFSIRPLLMISWARGLWTACIVHRCLCESPSISISLASRMILESMRPSPTVASHFSMWRRWSSGRSIPFWGMAERETLPFQKSYSSLPSRSDCVMMMFGEFPTAVREWDSCILNYHVAGLDSWLG